MLSPRGSFQNYRLAHPAFWYGSLARDASALSSKNKHCIRVSSFNTAKYFYASLFLQDSQHKRNLPNAECFRLDSVRYVRLF